MKRPTKTLTLPEALPQGQLKAILRGGTFHRVQIRLEKGLDTVEHCGLQYKVTGRRDSEGRVICTWLTASDGFPSF